MPPSFPSFPDLPSRIAFITGIGQTPVPGISPDVWGNGAAIALGLASNVVTIFGVDVSLEAAELTKSRILAIHPNASVDLHVADVTSLPSIESAIEACISKHGKIDILVNNVGMTRSGDPVTMSEEIWDAQIDLNLKSVFLTTKCALPHMPPGSAIINNASMTAIRYINKPQIAYAASKAAVVQLTKHTACLYAEEGVRCNVVIPGLIHTPLVEGLKISEDKGDNAAYESIIGAKIPGGKLGDAFDVANAMLFLASNASKYVNGHELLVDGGMSCAAG